ncbi:MAG: hypothetical protein R2752_20470 [Vicinamibacterales bacterium]
MAIVTFVFARASAPTAIWSPVLVDHPGFSPTDPAEVQERWPAVGTATGLTAAITERLDFAADDAAGASLSGIPTLAGVLAVLVVFAALRGLGAGLTASAAAALGLAFGSVFWSRAAGGQPATYGAVFALTTLGTLLWWASPTTRRPLAAVAAGTSAGLLVAAQPASIFGLPAALAFVWWTRMPRSTRATAAGLLTAGALSGAMGAWVALGVPAPRAWLVPHGLDGLAGRALAAGGLLVSDFGILGIVFLAAGTIALAVRDRRALVLLAGWPVGAAVGSLLWAAPDWRTTALPALAAAWLGAGLGMQWLIDWAGRRRGVALALVILLPVMSVPGHYQVGARARTARHFVAAHLTALRALLPAGPVVIAEGGAVDRIVAGWNVEASADVWPRVAQDPARLDALRASGRPIVAFAGARANLEALGFRFAPLTRAGVPMTPDALVATVPEGWIVAVATGSRFGQWMPPTGKRPAFEAIGGRTSTFGTRGRYALIGVRSHPSRAREEFGNQATAEVDTGDDADAAFRWPATIRAISDETGGRIEYGGRVVARTTTGLALVVVSSTGALAGAFASEFDDGLHLRISPSAFAPARLEGREPCVVVGERWTDIARVTGLASLGALIDPGRRTTVWLAGPNRLFPRFLPLRRAFEPDLVQRRFTGGLPDDDGPGLADMLAEDDVAGAAAAAIRAAPYALRLETAAASGRSMLALRLGGSAPIAVARLEGDGSRPPADGESGPADTVRICSAMRGIGLFADVATTRETVPLGDADLFAYGWDRLEYQGARRRRWTRVPRAELLVPLARTMSLDVEIEIEAAGRPGTVATLAVNDAFTASLTLEAGVRVYRWSVPAEAWRIGMNRLTLGTSALVRPSDVSDSRDDRELGLSVSGVGLVSGDFRRPGA